MSIRLIDVKTLRLKSFNSSATPPYAILSHTWVEDEEVSFEDMFQIAENPNYPATQRSGYRKIEETCRLAKRSELEYVWVDTCCIDKSSSTELSEAINSMFRWYQNAAVCFAYLSDYTYHSCTDISNISESELGACRWFTRGWCLQELVAPKTLLFIDKSWARMGSKSEMKKTVAAITGIDSEVLEDHSVMYSLPVARRMSWASKRETTRVEDIAYCLLGMFDINMPMIYGEGERAFVRLQEEIIRRSNDISIVLSSPEPRCMPPVHYYNDYGRKHSDLTATWRACFKTVSPVAYFEESLKHDFHSILGKSPRDFRLCGDLIYKPGSRAAFERPAFSITNRGLQIGGQDLLHNLRKWNTHCYKWETPFVHRNRNPKDARYGRNGAIFLRKIGHNLFAKVSILTETPSGAEGKSSIHDDVCVLLDVPPSKRIQIRTALTHALRIQVDRSLRKIASISISRQIPEDRWDDCGALFLLPEETEFEGSFRITISKDNQDTHVYVWFVVEAFSGCHIYLAREEFKERPFKMDYYRVVHTQRVAAQSLVWLPALDLKIKAELIQAPIRQEGRYSLYACTLSVREHD